MRRRGIVDENFESDVVGTFGRWSPPQMMPIQNVRGSANRALTEIIGGILMMLAR